MCLLSLRFFLHTSERIIKTVWSTLIDMILNLTITLMCIPVLSVGIKRQDKTKLFSTEFILIFVLSNNFHALFWNPLLTPRVCSHEDHNLSQRSNYIDCSTPGFPVLHLPEFAQTQVHWVDDSIQPSISSSVIPFSSNSRPLPTILISCEWTNSLTTTLKDTWLPVLDSYQHSIYNSQMQNTDSSKFFS